MNRKWTDEMDNELRRIYPCTTAKETARMLGVTQMAVQQRAIRLGLRKGYDWRKIRLTQEQKNWLRRNYPDMANAILALYLGMSESFAKDGAVHARGTTPCREKGKGKQLAQRHLSPERVVLAQLAQGRGIYAKTENGKAMQAMTTAGFYLQCKSHCLISD